MITENSGVMTRSHSPNHDTNATLRLVNLRVNTGFFAQNSNLLISTPNLISKNT